MDRWNIPLGQQLVNGMSNLHEILDLSFHEYLQSEMITIYCGLVSNTAVPTIRQGKAVA